ncbi:MAG: hypothetical protein ACK48D_02705, partial [Pseudanabaena sp.]
SLKMLNIKEHQDNQLSRGKLTLYEKLNILFDKEAKYLIKNLLVLTISNSSVQKTMLIYQKQKQKLMHLTLILIILIKVLISLLEL